jgi:hypothetical protein
MLKRIFLVLILISALAGIAHLTKKMDGSKNEKIHTPTALEKQGDICAGIADNAVANMHAIIEFQKLEILARKANIMKRCMEDHGFIENPAWLTYATSIANQTALKLNISKDEALENLKKQDMYILNVRKDKPLYWKKSN